MISSGDEDDGGDDIEEEELPPQRKRKLKQRKSGIKIEPKSKKAKKSDNSHDLSRCATAPPAQPPDSIDAYHYPLLGEAKQKWLVTYAEKQKKDN